MIKDAVNLRRHNMKKKIMIITGSPRKDGNTAALVKWVMDGAKEAEAQITLVDSTKLDYKTRGCICCMGCQVFKKYECVIKDEAHEILKNIPKQDVVIFATPVYFMGFTAQIKHIIDRMYSLMKFKPDHSYSHPMAKTEIAFIASSGGGLEDGLHLAEQTMLSIAQIFRPRIKTIKKLTVPYAPINIQDILNDEKLKAESVKFGKQLAK